MDKSDLTNWLQEEYRQWQGFLDQFDAAQLDQPDVTGHWSMKDVVAHLAGWNRKLVNQLRAAQRGEPEPPTPWPAHLEDEDDINAWIYETHRERPVNDVLDESHHIFQQLLAVIDDLPGDVRIETIQASSGREYHLVWVNDQRYPPGEFFDHFRDDHEPDIRAWLEQRKPLP